MNQPSERDRMASASPFHLALELACFRLLKTMPDGEVPSYNSTYWHCLVALSILQTGSDRDVSYATDHAFGGNSYGHRASLKQHFASTLPYNEGRLSARIQKILQNPLSSVSFFSRYYSFFNELDSLGRRYAYLNVTFYQTPVELDLGDESASGHKTFSEQKHITHNRRSKPIMRLNYSRFGKDTRQLEKENAELLKCIDQLKQKVTDQTKQNANKRDQLQTIKEEGRVTEVYFRRRVAEENKDIAQKAQEAEENLRNELQDLIHQAKGYTEDEFYLKQQIIEYRTRLQNLRSNGPSNGASF